MVQRGIPSPDRLDRTAELREAPLFPAAIRPMVSRLANSPWWGGSDQSRRSSSRNQPGRRSRAQSAVTVPLTMEAKVPGSPAVAL